MEREDKRLSFFERVGRATAHTIKAAEEEIDRLIKSISGRGGKKSKPTTREEDLLLNEKEREERDQLKEREKTRYTDEQCVAMIKNRCLPPDAPYWVRYQIEKIRLKALADEKHPEEEMQETFRAIEKRDKERRKKEMERRKKENEKLRQHI